MSNTNGFVFGAQRSTGWPCLLTTNCFKENNFYEETFMKNRNFLLYLGEVPLNCTVMWK